MYRLQNCGKVQLFTNNVVAMLNYPKKDLLMTQIKSPLIKSFFTYLIFLLFLHVPVSLLAAPSQSPKETDIEQRLEVTLTQKLQERTDVIDARMLGELKEHREYLKGLDERFYNHITFWLPTAITISTVFFGMFLFLTGRSKKEAVDATIYDIKVSASNTIRENVNTLVVEGELAEEISRVRTSLSEEVKKLGEDFNSELIRIKNEVASDNSEVIKNAVGESVKSQFSKEFDLMERIKKLEKTIKVLEVNVVKQQLALNILQKKTTPFTLSSVGEKPKNAANILLDPNYDKVKSALGNLYSTNYDKKLDEAIRNAIDRHTQDKK